MMAEIKLKKELLERLQLKSEEIGVNPNDLLEQYVTKGLNEDPSEWVNLSEVLSDLDGIIELDEETDAIELRDMARERRL